jgi:thiamine pyrophosphate-dependent acetolactate synthase large subunit-like protein
MGCSASAVRNQAQCDHNGEKQGGEEQTLATNGLKAARDDINSAPQPPDCITAPPPDDAAKVLPHVPEGSLLSPVSRPRLSRQEKTQTMNVCAIICEGLVLAGITHVFGGYGDDVAPLIDAICNHPKLTWVCTCIEVSASLIAAAYAKLTGTPGCCLASSGPGASHMVTGLMDANLDRVPVICLTGMMNAYHIGRNSAHDLDQTNLFKAGGIRHSHTCLHRSSIVCLFREMLMRAVTSDVCVHIAVPLTVQQKSAEVHEVDLAAYGDLGADSVPDSAEVVTVASHLVACTQNGERMLMAIGHRCSGEAATSALKLAEYLRCPIVTTLDAKGFVPEDHDQVIGVLGIFGNPGMEASAELVASATIVLSIGVDEHSQLLVGASGVQQTRFVEIDKRGLQEKRFQAEHVLSGTISRVLEQLVEEVKTQLFEATSKSVSGLMPLSELGQLRSVSGVRDNRAFSWNFRTECGFNVDSLTSRTCNYNPPKDEISPGYCHPGFVLKHLGELLPKDAIVCVDVGDCALWVGLALCLTGSGQRCLASMRMGTMGYSIYGAIAAAAARPTAQIVGIAGDGATQMATNEFATIVQMQAPVVLIIFINGKLGRVHNETWGPADAEPPQGCGLDNPDFCELAEAYGGKGIRINESDAELVSQAIQDAFACKGLCVIEVIQNPDVRPCMHKRKTRQLRTRLGLTACEDL